MINYFKNIYKNELFWGSFIIIFLSNVSNLINYVYHFWMARMLDPVNYGILAILTNFIYIFGVPAISIQTIVIKNVAKHNSKKDYGKIKYFSKKILIFSLVIGILGFILFAIASIELSKVLKIDYWLLIVTGLFLIITCIYSITTGIIQGLKKFTTVGINSVINSVIKLIFAIIFVTIGFATYGAIFGFLIGIFFALILTIPFIKEIIFAKEEKTEINLLSRETMVTFFAMLIIVLIYNLDLILARVLFSPEIVGQYASLSMLGKLILFGAIAIASVMFTITSEKFSSGINTKETLKKAIVFTLIWCLGLTLFISVFSRQIIQLLFGEKYLSLNLLMPYTGIAFCFIAFLNLFILYQISIENFKIRHFVALFILFIIQIISLVYFSNTIEHFAETFMFSNIIIFIASLLLIRKEKK